MNDGERTISTFMSLAGIIRVASVEAILNCARRSVAMAMTVALILAANSIGCGEKQTPRAPLGHVAGTLLVDGRPAAGAMVWFNMRSGTGIRPMARVGDDGKFQPSTYVPNDGVVPGEYVLTVTWPATKIIDGEEMFGPDQLNNRYADPQRPVASITVKEGENQLDPIELKTR